MRHPKIIYSLPTIYKIAHDAKQQNKRIGVTHGAYDLFHHSHLDLIQKSSNICDFLIVGVESDRGISSYKSYHRPIIPEESRLSIISSLRSVDAVFIKDIDQESDPHIELYQNLMSDIITIGLNFFAEEKIQYDTVKAGAEFLKIQTRQDFSTTRIINEIIDRFTESSNSDFKLAEKI